MNRLDRRRTVIAASVVLPLVIVVWLLVRGGPDEEEVTPEVSVQTAVAVVKPLTTTIDVLGTVEARPGHSAQIGAPQPAPVVAVYVAIGDVVRAGQALVQLDKSTFAARRMEAEAALAASERAFERTQRLLTEGIAPRKDVEAAAADLARARADLQQARHTEALATLRSPINGVVTTLNAALAQPVDVNAPVVEVVDPRGLEIRFHLSPADAGRITRGTAVVLASDEEGQHVSVGRGSVTGVSAAVDSATGAVDVRATISAPSRPLKAGETLHGSIELNSAFSRVIVPVEALVPEGDGVQVFVVDAQDVAHAIAVEVGNRTATEAEILSGLHGGETVVTNGAYGVSDGSRVNRGKKPA